MDHSIKKKPEKPRMQVSPNGSWMLLDREILIASDTAAATYQEWERIRIALTQQEAV